MTKNEAMACYARLLEGEGDLRTYLSRLQEHIEDLEALSGYYLSTWEADRASLNAIPFPELYEEGKLLDTFERYLDYLDELIDIAESVSIEG